MFYITKPVHKKFKKSTNSIMTTPSLVFIIPYRDRKEQLHFFNRQIAYILEDYAPDTYKILFVHQCDKRSFNRGALKNIGFLVVKDLYPDTYQDITLVFNDIDTVANRKNYLNFETSKGIVKHFYGFTFALGGIVSIQASDFELMNGFPNFWAWGYEDNLLQKRVSQNKLQIDRQQFHKLMDSRIIHLNESIKRVVNREEYNRYVFNTNEGIRNIKGVVYTMDESTNFVNVSEFDTGIQENTTQQKVHDITNTDKPFGRLKMQLF